MTHDAVVNRRSALLAAVLGLLLTLVSVSAACDSSSNESDPTMSIATTAPTIDAPATARAMDTPLSPTVTTLPTSVPGVRVVRVIDGDTIEIEGGERVRYIGVDTPESTIEHECFGSEASWRNAELVAGKMVQLERDVSERDRFDRLLRYVWLDGVLINEVLVREGFASVSTYPPDVKYQERFLAAQTAARSVGAGLWSACGNDEPVLPPTNGGGCDASYPDVCIPPYPPDLDCGQIAERRFRVVPPDDHGFDGDYDGVGCESG